MFSSASSALPTQSTILSIFVLLLRTIRVQLQLYLYHLLFHNIFFISKLGVYTKFSDMLANKCSQLVFVFDTTAFIPSEFITISRFMRLNRIFMIYRVRQKIISTDIQQICNQHYLFQVVIYIRKIENSFKVNVAVVRCIKYVIYLLYISYCTAVIYYMSACDKDKYVIEVFYVFFLKYLLILHFKTHYLTF